MDITGSSDERWQALLACGASTFAGDSAPPFGFVTNTLARLRAEGENRLLEKIGFRALFASLAILVAAGGVTIGFQLQNHFDLDSGLNSIMHPEDFPLA